MSESLEKSVSSVAVKSKLEKLLAKREQAQQVVLVLDCSGSMQEQGDSPGERRIDSLRGVISNLHQQGIVFRQLVFNSSCMWSDIVPEPSGGTNLANALEFCEKIQAKHVIVVSDGQPDSRDAALAVAKRLNCQIDVFYVGPKGDASAQEFMKQLASLTGGSTNVVSFKELQRAVAGMLTSGDEVEEKKTIAL